MVILEVTAWQNYQEWNHIRDLVLKKDKSALDYIDVWNSRTSKLPIGVEATKVLLKASFDMNNDLTLSMGISSFLKHMTHIGMKVYQAEQFAAVARILSIPEWVIEVRNEFTHGVMPSLFILRSAFHVCWSWIVLNYWHEKKTSYEKIYTSVNKYTDRASSLLDLYMYLKIYSIWGTKSLQNIATEEAVFNHMQDLWASCVKQNGNNLVQYSVSQALECVKLEMKQLRIKSKVKAEILVDQDLLIPEQDFLKCLSKEGEMESECVVIPNILLAVWRSTIQNIDAKVGAKVLIDLLVKNIEREDVDEYVKEYSCAWIVELVEALLGQSNQLTLKKDHGCTMTDLESWLQHGSRFTLMLLPCFTSLVPVSNAKCKLLHKLLSAASGESATKNKTNYDHKKLFTLDDLQDTKENSKIDSNWVRQNSISWQKGSLFQTFGSETWEPLWLESTCEWESVDPETICYEVDKLDVDVERIVWPAPSHQYESPQVDHVLPPFYRRKSKQYDNSLRRKRIKLI